MTRSKGVQPQELTALLDKRMIVAIRKAFVAKTKQLKEDGEDIDGTYASLEVEEFMDLLRESNMIPEDVVDKITQFIDVNDDGDIEFDEFINFVLAAESNLEFSKKAGMEKFNVSVSKNLNEGRGGSAMENIDTLCYTTQPQSMIVGGGAGGEVCLYNSMTFKLVDKFSYESKAKSMKKSLMVGIRPEDQPRLNARIKEKAGTTRRAGGKVQLVSSCVLPNAPHMLVMGGADSSICVFDLTSQSSRAYGAVGRVDSLSSPAVCLLAVEDKARHYGETGEGGGGPPSPGGADRGLDGGGSSTIAGSSVSSGAGPRSPRSMKKRNSTLTAVSESATAAGSSSAGTDSDDDLMEENTPQTVYMGTAEGTLYWLTLDAAFGLNSAKNRRLFEESQLRAAGKQTADIVVEVETNFKTHAQKAQEIAGFSKYRLEEDDGGVVMPWQRAKMMREKEALAAKEAKEEVDKYRNLPLPCATLHSQGITRSLYVQEIDSVLCASLDGTISIFSHETKTHTRTIRGTHREAATNGILALSYSSKSRFVVSSADRALYVWELYTEEITHRMTDLPAIVTNVQTFDKEDIVVALLSNSTVYVWNSLNFELRQVLDGCGSSPDQLVSREEEMLRHLLVFENLEIARVESERASELSKARALSNPAQKNRKKHNKVANHPCSLCLGGEMLSLWRLSSGAMDEAASREIHKQPEDIVTVLFNSNFKLFIALYSLGTAKVFSVLSGASLREFTVCETDAFGKIKAELLQTDPHTGLLLPVIKDACFDCTQRRLLVVTRDDEVKVFNFFAGMEIDALEPNLPNLTLPDPAPSAESPAPAASAGASAGAMDNRERSPGEGKKISIVKDKDDDGDDDEDAEDGRRARESIATCMMVEMTGIEKPGREKFSRRLLFLGGSGATVSSFLDRGETIDEHPHGLYKWSKRPIDYVSRMLSMSIGGGGPGSDIVSMDSNHGRGGYHVEAPGDGAMMEGLGMMMPRREPTRVLWNIYMDFKGNNHCNGMVAGDGNGMSSGRDKGSFMIVGYSNGTCICYNANSVSVVSRPDPSAVGTVLHGMKRKLNAGDDATAGSSGKNKEKEKEEEHVPRMSRLHSMESNYEGSAISAAKPTTITIDCAVGLYTPQMCVLIGACSDRYLKFWNSDTGQVLCSVSYIHGDPSAGDGRGGGGNSLYSAGSAGGATREDEERIKSLKIRHNITTDSYALAAGYDNGTVRVWEVTAEHLSHLQEQLDIMQREAEDRERLDEAAAREEAEIEAATAGDGGDEVRGASPVSRAGQHMPGILSDDVLGADVREVASYEGVTAPARAQVSAFTSKSQEKVRGVLITSAPEDPSDMLKGGDLDDGALGLGVCPVTLCEEFVAHNTSILSMSIVHLDSSEIEAASAADSAEEEDEEQSAADNGHDDDGGGGVGSVQHPRPPLGGGRSSGGRGLSRREKLKAQHEAVKRPDPKDYRKNPFRTDGDWTDLFKKDSSTHAHVADNKFAQDYYLITSTLAGECMLWTMHGVFIGQFGGKIANKWDLSKPASWPNRWLINNDNEGEDDTEDKENAKKKNAKDTRPTLSIMSTLEAEVARAFKGAKPNRRLTSDELNAQVEKHLRETQGQPPVSQEHSKRYHKMIQDHPVVDTINLQFSSSRVARMDV